MAFYTNEAPTLESDGQVWIARFTHKGEACEVAMTEHAVLHLLQSIVQREVRTAQVIPMPTGSRP